MTHQITIILNGQGMILKRTYPEGTTYQDVFADTMPGKNAGDYIIRVNHSSVYAIQEVQDGDKVSITPIKIWVGRALPTRPEIEDDLDNETEARAAQQDPRTNGFNEICHWCKQPTEVLMGRARICKRCNK